MWTIINKMNTNEVNKEEQRRIYKRDWMRYKRQQIKDNPCPSKTEMSDNEKICRQKKLQEYQKKYHSTYKRPEKYFTCCDKIRHIRTKNIHMDSVEHLKRNGEIIPGIKIE